MVVRIEDTCTACGLCVDTCPEVFAMGDEIAEVIVDEVPAEHEDADIRNTPDNADLLHVYRESVSLLALLSSQHHQTHKDQDRA